MPINLNVNKSVEKLSILVENQGRINYGSFIEDRKVSVLYFKLSLLFGFSFLLLPTICSKSSYPLYNTIFNIWPEHQFTH